MDIGSSIGGTIMIEIVMVLIAIGFAIFGYVIGNSRNKPIPIALAMPKPEPVAPIVNVDLKPILDTLDELPHKVLQSVQSSANVHKGALGELIGYMKLHAEYDRIIPLNNIVDFICIKLPSKDVEGYIDFVDVKTGDKARLSKDQRALQALIKEKKINFVKLKIQTSTGVPVIENTP